MKKNEKEEMEKLRGEVQKAAVSASEAKETCKILRGEMEKMKKPDAKENKEKVKQGREKAAA